MGGMFQEEQPSKHRIEPQETKKWMEEPQRWSPLRRQGQKELRQEGHQRLLWRLRKKRKGIREINLFQIKLPIP